MAEEAGRLAHAAASSSPGGGVAVLPPPSSSTLASLLLRRGVVRSPLSPVANNALAALVTVVYVKAVMEAGTAIRVRYGVPELSRKFVHFCACSIVCFWPLFDATHWGWRLNVTVPAVMSLRLLYKGAILKDPEDEDVRSMSRTSSPSELLYGPLQMTAIMCYVGLTKFMTFTGVAIMAALVGDGAAALVGMQYGKHRFKVPLGDEKSVEGTIGCALGTMGAMWLFSYMCGIEVLGWKIMGAYGCVAAAAEATALRSWDNLLLAVAMGFSAKHLSDVII